MARSTISVKPVWAEGILLGQQHMQLQEKFLLQQQARQQQIFNPFAYGCSVLDIDQGALARGILSIVRVEALFKSGRLVQVEAGLTESRKLQMELPETQAEITIALAMAANDAVAGVNGYGSHGAICAFDANFIELADSHDLNRTREVLVATPNLFLMPAGAAHSDIEQLPILRLQRDTSGSWQASETFVPPQLNVHSNLYLRSFLKKTCDLVNAKVGVLLNRRNDLGSVTDFGPNEMNTFLLLSTMVSHAAHFEHLKGLNVLHPERFYCQLTELISNVSVFEHADIAAQLPKYDHDDLAAVFTQLEQSLGQLIDGVVPKKMAPLTLQRKSSAIYQVPTLDPQLLDGSELYLAVYFEAESTQWIDVFTEQVKLAASEQLEILVASALDGIAITHCQRPPNKLAIKGGYEYFRVEPRGDAYQQLRKELSLSLFVPFSLQAAKIELVSVGK
ncbi:type VI secretion system baseplate subunit TssK [Pseudoalteromonas fenneropenaei]|uniref:Type VI secretion system baseplate subunit TssK n=1 Tax=Pseudoalteromonas fenneropenaei TaxID=1737459 RepID=A0ABV7CHT2_9GAMM